MIRPHRPTRALRARVRPLVERLEGREAPAVLTVTNLSDHDPGSLRAQIAAAADGDTILFAADVRGQITLTSGGLVLDKSLSVTGPGASVLSVSGDRASAVFSVYGGPPGSGPVTISGLTVTGGGRGGISFAGLNPLVVTDSAISGNDGSGIYINRGTATVTACTLTGNSGAPSSSGPSGGGIYNGGTLTVTACTIAGNTATNGAGIFNTGSYATATVTACTIAGNTARIGGGLVNFNGGTLAVTASTVSNNTAYFGGGIWSSFSPLTVTSCTVAGNSSLPGAGGGGITTESAPMAVLRNTVVALNKRGPDADDIQASFGGGVAASSAYNLIGTGGSGGLVDGVNGNQVGVSSPGLGTLGYYGGPTQTVPLLAGSPAVGTGDPSLAGTDDQRGFRRGPTPSVGAAEYVPGNAAYLFVTAPASVTAGVPFAVTVAAVDASGDPAPGYTGPLLLESTDPQAPATLGSYELTAADAGTHTFTVTLYSAPTQQLLARTHPFVGVAEVTVAPAAAAFLYLVPSSYAVSAGSPLSVTAVLYDAYGNRATNFTGTLHFAVSDPAATLPADYTFTAADAGSHAFTLTLNTPGPVTITASVVGSPGVSFELDLSVA